MAQFGKSLNTAFVQEVSGHANYGEIKLFRCLMDAFKSLSPAYFVEEYHGAKKQVYFDPLFPWDGRKTARCELADLLIVWYTTNPIFQIRVTFLQAKYERKKVINPVSHIYSANMEQWDLLANRPEIDGVGRFFIPRRLLADAVLPSIGSFGFFYQKKSKVEFFYISAESLCYPSFKKHKRNHKLLAKSNIHQLRQSNGSLTECVYADDLISFGNALYAGLIGSPLNPSATSWLISGIAAHCQAGELASELGSYLIKSNGKKIRDSYDDGIGTQNIILVKGNQNLNVQHHE